MVVLEMIPEIEEATSIFHIGGVAGHRPQEHVFCIKAIMARFEEKKKKIVLIPYDISKFFDKEVLLDAMQELHSIGVDPRAYRLFYKLNKNTRIKVRTGCGDSEYEEVGDILGQGSGGAAKVSALNLSRKLDRVFEDDKDIVGYGSVIQKPYSFQDDIMIPVDSLENVRLTYFTLVY